MRKQFNDLRREEFCDELQNERECCELTKIPANESLVVPLLPPRIGVHFRNNPTVRHEASTCEPVQLRLFREPHMARRDPCTCTRRTKGVSARIAPHATRNTAIAIMHKFPGSRRKYLQNETRGNRIDTMRAPTVLALSLLTVRHVFTGYSASNRVCN